MREFPPIAGWPTEYPEYSPIKSMLLVHEDLVELQENPKLAKNDAWMHKFAKNALELDKDLDRFQKTKDLEIQNVRNWFKNALVHKHSLSDALWQYDEADFKEIKGVKKFMNDLVDEDFESIEALDGHFQKFLKDKHL